MLNKEALKPAAKAAFEKKIVEQVEFLSEHCWDTHVNTHLATLNRILRAGDELGVDNLKVIDDNEIFRLVNIISPLRTLGMSIEVLAILIDVLTAHGVDSHIFNSPTK